MMVIDTAVCILCQTQLLSKKRNAVPEFEYSRDRLVQCSIGHFFVVEGINDGGVKEARRLPSPFRET